LAGMIVLAFVGVQVGAQMAQSLNQPAPLQAAILGLLGALIGLIVTPWLTTRPIRLLRKGINQLPTTQLAAGITGLILGLVIALLVSFPLSLLPQPFGQTLPFLCALLFAYLGIVVMAARQNDIAAMIGQRLLPTGGGNEEYFYSEQFLLLDTSVIIDGRIADISRTGFISGTMLVPQFVLNELQHIADSSDALRRNRGRRGLDILNQLQKEPRAHVRITDMDAKNAREVDDKLVALAKQLRCPVLTNDYNLNRVAELQGVHVLNVNELANAVKAVFLPGETIQIKIIQEGKELGQGVGYLDDGTMVVVEDGKRYIGDTVDMVVTKVLQTAAGRMIFAKPENHNGE
jgi:uncharacterized protein YacL